jgi:hypothetical protein
VNKLERKYLTLDAHSAEILDTVRGQESNVPFFSFLSVLRKRPQLPHIYTRVTYWDTENFKTLKTYIDNGGDLNWRFACGDTWAERVTELQTRYNPFPKGTPIEEVSMWGFFSLKFPVFTDCLFRWA